MANLNFNARNVDPVAAYEPLPAGWYQGMIIDSQMKASKRSSGHYLELAIEVLGPHYAGCMIWDRLNLDNPNNISVMIAKKKLSAICHAVGVLEVQDSQQLHDRPFDFKVKIESGGMRDDGTEYEPRNAVSGYRAARQDGAPTMAQTAALTQPAPPTGTPYAEASGHYQGGGGAHNASQTQPAGQPTGYPPGAAPTQPMAPPAQPVQPAQPMTPPAPAPDARPPWSR